MSRALPDGYVEADVERPVSREPSLRSPFARDRARVLHSAALRRLAAKTQVFVAGSADFPRTRLTHTLEVAQLAREMGQALGCDPDLVDVAGLAHDLGHPPFGHNGERELNVIADRIGGFEGNAQTLRVLTRLEAKVIDPVTGQSVGLDLTRASLDASCKYPWPRRVDSEKFGYYSDDAEIFHWLRRGAPDGRTCLEEQVMDWADDVAYSVHDVEDALHAGHVALDMFTSATERENIMDIAHRKYLPQVDPAELSAALDRLLALDYWPAAYTGTHRDLAALKEFTSRLIGRFCQAAEQATREAYPTYPLTRYAATLVVPDQTRAEVAVMKAVTVLYVMRRAGAKEAYA
ncbi:MAG: deoxyguanosinetriphosphate triphosphohydrolase, partial [Actinomycetota bacterium]